ncbi:MAG: mechanosensitive ion channel domain-containing protein [Pseudomonadota bacterium]
MISTPLSSLLSDLADDLRDPGVIWQICAVSVCLLLGWWLARFLRGSIVSTDTQPRVIRLGVDSFSRALSPLITVLLLVIAKYILIGWQNVNLLRLAIPVVGSLALIRFALYVLRRIFAQEGRVGNALSLFEKLFASLVWVGVVLYIFGLWPNLLQYLENTLVPIGKYKISLGAIFQALVSVAVMLLIALWAGAALEERLMKMDTVHSSFRVVMARTGRAVLILIAILSSLSMVGIDLTVLSVFGGALGVGLGLGLQKIASNYVSGFVILLDRSLSIGDMIGVDKYYGKVTQINTRYTVLQGQDGIEYVIPNEMLISGPVQNYSLSNRKLRLAVNVSIAYESDVEKILPQLELVTSLVTRVSHDMPPQAFLKQFGQDGLELEIGFWIDDPENGKLGVISDVNRAIWNILQTAGVRVPFPQREVRLVVNGEFLG